MDENTPVPLNQQTIDLAFDILANGKMHDRNGLLVLPLEQCFEKSDTVVAKHILWGEFKERTGCHIPKIFGYIVMDKVFGQCDGKDYKGDLGYYLKVKDKLNSI